MNQGASIPVYLTKQQRKIVDFIRDSTEREGIPPSYSEIANFLGIHKGAVQWHLQTMTDKGILRRKRGKHRSLEVVESKLPPIAQRSSEKVSLDSVSRSIPLMGSIVAGLPEEEQEDRSDLDPVDFLTDGKDCFLLRVRGESMIEAHIQEGDLVVVDPRRRANNGDIVAALVDGDNTLKRLRKKGSTVYLEAANPDMPKQIIGQEGQIQGVVTGLIRKI